MILLTLDTSTPHGSVALVRCQPAQCSSNQTPDQAHTVPATPEIVFENTFHSARSHNALLFAPLQEALQLLGSAKPDAIMVGTGPGSYTGIRIGIAAAHGLAAALEIPWYGWNSLATLCDDPEFVVIGDARRGCFFHVKIVAGKLTHEPEILPLSQLTSTLENLNGPLVTTDESPLTPTLISCRPRAACIARYYNQARLNALLIEPLYLRAPYITLPKTRP